MENYYDLDTQKLAEILNLKDLRVTKESNKERIISAESGIFDVTIHEMNRQNRKQGDMWIVLNYYHRVSAKKKSILYSSYGNFSKSMIEGHKCEYVPREPLSCGRNTHVEISKFQTDNRIRTNCIEEIEPYEYEFCDTYARYMPLEGFVTFIRHEKTCSKKCLVIIPFLGLGEYLVRKKCILQEKPNLLSSKLGTLEVGEEVQILEDTQIFEEIEENIAPWVKVRLKNGNLGFIYSVYLRRPNQLFP